MTNPAERVAEAASVAVESVVAEAGAAVEAANERAEAAAEVAKLVSEAAIQREISDDVEELDEELEQCRADVNTLRQQVTALQETVTTLQQSLTTLVTLEMLTAELAKLSQPPSIQVNSSETQTQEQPTHRPGVEEGRPAPEETRKQSRFRLT